MKFVALALLLAGFTAVTFSSEAYAEGGKVRGEVGSGEVNQVQVNDPLPFAG